MHIAENLSELIGHTPLVRINKLNPGPGAVYAKLEMFNPCSIKDRAAQNMLAAAEKQGLLKPGGHIVEPTSGNMGIALAFLAAVKGYAITLTMPENMSPERVKMLKALGANIVLTPAQAGMKGAIEKAQEILAQTPGAFMPSQFENPANAQAHRQTAQEILNALDGKVDTLVCGVGTGGTLTGTATELKKHCPHLHTVAVEPADSPVLSGGKAGPHKLQGIGAGFIPKILDTKLCSNLCIDIANGYIPKLLDYVKKVRNKYPDITIMVGNVVTGDMTQDLILNGADIVKVGIGPGCFTPNMKVKTNVGLKNIKDIQIGDNVLTHKNQYKKVTNKFEYNEFNKIISINGIESTKHHEYYVVNKKYKDIITDENIHDYAEWVSADKLTKDYYLIKSTK